METLEFSIIIEAPVNTVWDTMLTDGSYRKWTSEFHEGSFYEGRWFKGSEIKFMAAEKDGTINGMISVIKESIPHKYISIEHQGLIKNGKIDTASEEVKKWTPAFENYTFTDLGSRTEIKVEMQVMKEYRPMFEKMWPRALNALKRLCEQ
jgi:hypothetical protein